MSTEYTRQEAAKLQAILNQEKYVEQMKFRADMAKRKAQLAKRQYDEAVATLIDTIKADSSQMLLPGMEDDNEPQKLPTWQDTPIHVVVGDKAIVEKLAEYNIRDLGQLAAYTNAGHALTKVGLTEHQEAKVVEALRIYWESEPGAGE